MTETQLDRIEAELGLKLPADYRAASREFPFRRMGNEEVYWFYDDPEQVINATRYPMNASDYDMTNWKPTYLTIGHGAAGDEHLIDTALTESPVYLISHEDLSIVEEWASLSAFVEDWEQEVKLWEQGEVERARQRQLETQRLRRLAVVMMLIIIVVVLTGLFVRLPPSMRRSHRQAPRLVTFLNTTNSAG